MSEKYVEKNCVLTCYISIIFQAKVSIWSKTSNTKIENSGAYSLERRSILNIFHKHFFISHKETVDIPVNNFRIKTQQNHNKKINT